MKNKPRKESSILDHVWKFIVLAGILTFAVKFTIFLITLKSGVPIEEVRSSVLTTVILFELFFVYTCRSENPLLKEGVFSNKWLNYAVLFSIMAHLILLYTPLAGIFKLVPLTLKDWLFILPFSISGLIIFEIRKYFKKKKSKPN
jgi:Ca2+-transporting ATPase